VLLVKPDAIPTPTAVELDRLSPATIYVVGGPNAVSEAVRSRLAAHTDSGSLASVVRLGGADRFETSVEVARATWDAGSANPFIATGRDFPDALSGGAYPRPLYLVDTNSVPPSVSADIGRLDPDAIQILGGPNVVSPGVEQTLARR
jgi:putative cell wall-binding protein